MRLIKSAVRGNHYKDILRTYEPSEETKLSDKTKSFVKRVARKQMRSRERSYIRRVVMNEFMANPAYA
jgi:hypothetical protein